MGLMSTSFMYLSRLASKSAGGGVAVGAGDDAHQDQAGEDELQVRDIPHLPDAASEPVAEDHDVEQRGEQRREQGLGPHLREPPDFTGEESPEGEAKDPGYRHIVSVFSDPVSSPL